MSTCTQKKWVRDRSIEGKSVIFQSLRADTDGVPSMNNPGMGLAVLSQILFQLQAVPGPSIGSSNAHSYFTYIYRMTHKLETN